MSGAHFSPMGMPGGGPTPFGPYAMYHPQMAMHYMPPMAMHGNMANMAAHMPAMATMGQPQQAQAQAQAQAQSMQAGGMHHAMGGAPPQMVHIYPAPIGYQMNPVTGRPMPVFPQAAPGVPADMNQQLQGQQQQAMGDVVAQPSAGGGSAGAEQASGSATPHTPHTPHMMQQMYVGGMPPPVGTMNQPMVPMFGPPLFMPPMQDPGAGNPSALPPAGQAPSATGFSLLPPGQACGGGGQQGVHNASVMSGSGSGIAAGTSGAAVPQEPSPDSNSAFLAAAMSAAYAETSSSSSSSSGATPHGGAAGGAAPVTGAEPAGAYVQHEKKSVQRAEGSPLVEQNSTSESAGGSSSSTAEVRKEKG